MKSYLKLLIGVILFCITLTLSVQAQIVISVPGKVKVNTPLIKLTDISSIKGINSAQLSELKQIDLGQAPLPGYSRKINKELISLLLQDKGFNVADFKLKMPDSIIVTTRSKEITADELKNFIKNFLFKQFSSDYNVKSYQDNIQIEFTMEPQKMIIPDTDYTLEIATNLKKFTGRISLPVVVKINGKIYKRTYVGLNVKIHKKVFVASRDIERGESIGKNDFKFEEEEITNIKGQLITDLNNELIKNGVVKKTIHKGEILTSNYLEIPVIISWGDQVQAEVIIGNVRVTAVVKARERGKIGDYILVENIKTGAKFTAQVINSHLVRVVQ